MLQLKVFYYTITKYNISCSDRTTTACDKKLGVGLILF